MAGKRRRSAVRSCRGDMSWRSSVRTSRTMHCSPSASPASWTSAERLDRATRRSFLEPQSRTVNSESFLAMAALGAMAVMCPP
eukprot:648391-Pyramimonas_sp.AAC.1